MKKVFIWVVAGLLFLPITGCGPQEYVEPDPIKELDIEGVPSFDDPGDGSATPADSDN